MNKHLVKVGRRNFFVTGRSRERGGAAMRIKKTEKIVAPHRESMNNKNISQTLGKKNTRVNDMLW